MKKIIFAVSAIIFSNTAYEIHSIQYNHLKILKSTLYFGAIISAGPAAFVASLAGLKAVLFVGSSIMAVGSTVIIYSANKLLWLYVGRLLHGLGVGIVFVMVPNYASEICELKTRRMLIALHYLNLLIGVLLSQVINEFYACFSVTSVMMIMSVINVMTLFVIDNPPYFSFINRDKYLNELDLDIKAKGSKHCDIIKKRMFSEDSFLIFEEYEIRRPIIVNFWVIVFQQFSGFIFLTSKLKCLYGVLRMSKTISDVVAVTIIQIMTCIICLFIIGFMRSKTLLLISGLGMTLSLCLMHITFNKDIKNHDELWLLNLICIYVICYSIGYGPVPWILMVELCPRRSKLLISGFTVSLYAFMNIINNQFLNEYTKQTIYYGIDVILLMFTFVNIICAIFTCVYLKESKNC